MIGGADSQLWRDVTGRGLWSLIILILWVPGLALAVEPATPLLSDDQGLVVTAAALVAERLAPGAKAWWQAGHRSPEPAHTLALNQLGLEPIVDLGMRLGEGTGAAIALPIVRAAVAALSSMATFADAGVSGPVDAEPTAP